MEQKGAFWYRYWTVIFNNYCFRLSKALRLRCVLHNGQLRQKYTHILYNTFCFNLDCNCLIIWRHILVGRLSFAAVWLNNLWRERCSVTLRTSQALRIVISFCYTGWFKRNLSYFGITFVCLNYIAITEHACMARYVLKNQGCYACIHCQIAYRLKRGGICSVYNVIAFTQL